jgi:uncharacterized membrane protein YhaH (DUF805 family)
MTLYLNKTLLIIKNVFSILIESIFVKYFKFSGRASRKEFLIFFVFYVILERIIFVKSEFINLPIFVNFFFSVFSLFPWITMFFRRFHDFNYSGLWLFVFIIIIVFLLDLYVKNNDNDLDYFFEYSVIFICLLFNTLLILIPGNSGSNRYGEPPR